MIEKTKYVKKKVLTVPNFKDFIGFWLFSMFI